MISLGISTIVTEGTKRANREQKRKALKRRYQAARRDRLTADWESVPTSQNWELRYSLRTLRARARALARNNSHFKKFLSMCRTNVVGPAGIKLQVRATDLRGELDEALNKRVEKAFKEWAYPENASVTGKLSWRDQQLLFVTTLARDGEVLAREIAADNPFGYALKFYDVNWLDENYNDTLASGNRVIMSIEVDALDRPVAYWLTPPPTEYQFRSLEIRQRTRIPASEIIHKFLVFEDEAQVRGVPWGHTAMLDLHMLKGYAEAEVVAARIGASKMGFFVPPEGDEFAGDVDEEESERPELMTDVSPGQFDELPPGYEVKTFDPQHPNAQVAAFVKVILRTAAAGLDVSYFSMAEDLEGVNYSSARIGLLSERDVWRGLQAWMIVHFCRPVYLGWLESAWLSGALGDLRARDVARLKEVLWQPRGWTWVDPLKEVQAHVTAIDNALESRTDVVAEGGGDFDELTTTIQREQKTLEQKGIKLQKEKPAKGLPAGEDDEGAEEE
ncbi:MAG TPA: phage portal protein [Pyrinomonadaceae bacterium]|nr:phage portal protein [Pyrinomonadaceae bacterium]